MPITTVTWIMTLSLVMTFILLNIFENKRIKESVKRMERDRRYFSYTYHIPERRSGYEMQKSERRLEKDRRYFSYAIHIPERRSDAERRFSQN